MKYETEYAIITLTTYDRLSYYWRLIIMTSKFTAIYVRRSVSDKEKGNDSLSIAAQREECIRYVGEETNFKVYCDDGKSGKDVRHRPEFMQMMSDAKDGYIDRIIVKKYDRFSRNMREYLNITDELDRYGVGVISLSEPFNTETKEGRMMRNNLLNFAEFERETIAARVKDAYSTKAVETGFYQGGKMFFGFQSSRQTINGKTGSVLVPSEAAQTVIAAYNVYKESGTSLLDVVNYIKEHELPSSSTAGHSPVNRSMDRSEISRILENPLYVRADKNVYEYFLSRGFTMIDDIDAYDGVHGLLWHKKNSEDRFIKVGYHEGLVDSETWLAVQDKKSHNHQIPRSRGELKSWLVGLTKCGHCGKALLIAYSYNADKTKLWRYYNCTGLKTIKGCSRETERLKVCPDDVERAVYKAMKEHISEFEVAKNSSANKSSEAERIKAELLRIETDTKKLIDRLIDADDVLFGYIQDRISELHAKKNEYEKQLLLIERRVKKIDTKPLIEPLNRWDELSMEEKNALAKVMINRVDITDEEGLKIHFSF